MKIKIMSLFLATFALSANATKCSISASGQVTLANGSVSAFGGQGTVYEVIDQEEIKINDNYLADISVMNNGSVQINLENKNSSTWAISKDKNTPVTVSLYDGNRYNNSGYIITCTNN